MHGLAVLFDIDQDQAIGRVVIPHVVGRGLEMPAQFAAVGIERNDRIGIEIVTLARIAVEQGRRIAGRPIKQVALGVVAAGHPSGRAAALPRVTGPALDTGLACGWYRIAPPALGTGIEGVGRDEAARRELTAAVANDDLVLDHEWRAGRAEAELVVGHRDIPQHLAADAIESDEARVERCHEDFVTGNRHAAIGRPTAQPQIGRHLMFVMPALLTGHRIERIEIVVRSGEIQHAIGHHR